MSVISTNYPSALDDSTVLPTAVDLANDNLDTKPHSTVHGNAHDAIIAIETELGTDPSGSEATVKARIAADEAALAAHLADTADAHDASAISVAATGTIASTDVQAALAELDSEKAATASAVMDGDAAGGVLSGTYPNPGFASDMATQTELDAHINDVSAAHAASAISADSTTLVGTGTDVQAVLEELDNGIADHLADTSAAHAASAISYNGGTGMSATDVEAAIDELATEKSDTSHTHTLDGLSDVIITTPSTGQVVKYNGSNWVNDTDATGGGGGALDDLSDVTITTPATGATLIYNGSAWVDGQLNLADEDAVTGVLASTHLDAELSAIAGLTSAADKVPYFTGSGTAAVTDLTSAARSVLDDTTVAAMRTTLGAGRVVDTDGGQTQTASNANLTAASLINTNGIQIPANPTVGSVYRLFMWGRVTVTTLWGTAPLHKLELKVGATTLTGQTVTPPSTSGADWPMYLWADIHIEATDTQRVYALRHFPSTTSTNISFGLAGAGVTTEDDASAISLDVLVTTTGSGGSFSASWECYTAALVELNA